MKITKYTYNGSLILAMAVFSASLIAKKPVGSSSLGVPSTAYKTAVASTGQFDGNKVRDDLENNGMIVSHRITGHSGMEWPKDNHTYSVYASGVWMAGKVGGDIRVTAAEYGPENVPGPYGGDASSAIHKLYKVSKSDLADPLASSDFQNWPTDLGAPWVDVDGDGVYTPLPTGVDHPEFVGDQVIWYVSNDGDATAHAIFHTLPLGVEIQTTIFGFDRPDAFGDMMFVKELIINKGGNTIEDLYIGLWSDPDLGDAGDDFVACDTTLGLGICYNDGVDHDYEGFSGGTPAVGYDFFQGPMVASAGDTAFMFGKDQPGYKNLSMSSFSKYINTSDPNWSDPNDAEEVYNLMQGLKKDGTPATNTETGDTTKFFYPDDPSLNTGVGDGIWADSDDHASGDRRFLMNTGPFTMADGDSQEVVFAIFHAAAGGPLQSVAYLKEVDALAQLAYDIQFALPESPPSPAVTATELMDEIILTWDNTAESYDVEDVIDKLPVPVAYDTTWDTSWTETINSGDIVIDTTMEIDITTGPSGFVYDTTYVYNVVFVSAVDTTFEGQNTSFKFEGYNVYQYETASGTGNMKRIATYDLANNITEIYDNVFDPDLGETINRRVQFGEDSGIKRHINIDSDALNNNSPLITNRVYYFAVSAYGYNPYGIPRTLESPLSITSLRPQVPNNWAAGDSTASHGDKITATHPAGASDGSVTVNVIDPTALTGDNYSVTFADTLSDGSAVTNWTLSNTSDGTTLISASTIQGGVDFVDATSVGANANVIVEGMMVEVDGPPLEFKDFTLNANAAGTLDPPARASASWRGYPSVDDPAGDYPYYDNSQASGAYWFLATNSTTSYEYADMYGYVTRYSGGYGNPNGGIGYIIPDDIEFRFTETGSKMFDWWGTEQMVDSPLEIWNVGVIDDPTDDFQLLAVFQDTDGDGEFSLRAADSPISGADNDPMTDAMYIVEHMDRAPGTAGYEAMVAAFEANPLASGSFPWASGPGLALSASGQISRAILMNIAFVGWNVGDVTADPFEPMATMPETGSVFRLITTKPNSALDSFTFSTSSVMGETAAYDAERVNAWPNPYFGANPEERNSVYQHIHFTHLPESGDYTIRIFDLSGRIVRLIDGSDEGSQYAVWDVKNNYGIPVASGMYLAHVTTASGEKVLKLGVIQPEQRIDRY